MAVTLPRVAALSLGSDRVRDPGLKFDGRTSEFGGRALRTTAFPYKRDKRRMTAHHPRDVAGEADG
jgi:hypothetical protein